MNYEPENYLEDNGTKSVSQSYILNTFHLSQ